MAHRIAKYNICAEFWGDEHHCRPPQYKFWGDVSPRPPVIYAHGRRVKTNPPRRLTAVRHRTC